MLLAAVPETSASDFSVMLALTLFIAASVWLGTLAQKAMEKQEFMHSFFLGGRGLGAWALALTATVQSGGTFMGFPSLVYSFGWIVLLWIGAYMVVPLTGFAVVGKRLAQLSRMTDAVTVPDLFRARFDDARVGIVSSLLIMTFLSFTMFAQFKAGATIMQFAWPGSGMLKLSEDIDAAPTTPASGTETSKTGVSHGGSGTGAAPTADSSWKNTLKAWFPLSTKYYIGLIVFALTVVGYTLIGGFLASVWTDLFQSVMMVFGVTLLVCLAVPMAGGLEQASRKAIERTAPDIAFGPGYSPVKKAVPTVTSAEEPSKGTDAASTEKAVVAERDRQFMTPGLALSMFFIWIFAGFASPASMVRVMAAQNTEVIRKSIVLLSCYNCLIYIPLVMVCIAARSLIPDLGAKSDEVIPRMSLLVTQNFPWNTGSFVSGLILAAPFGAIMASVSCFVLVIASGLVQDLYARFINPQATETQLRRATTVAMVLVGTIAVLAVLNPPQYLQALVVLSSSAGAATLVVPLFMTCYWRRATAAGVLSAMLTGFLVYFAIYSCGWAQNWATANSSNSLATTILGILGPDPKIGPSGLFRPYYVLGVDPVLWAMLASFLAGYGVSLNTKPPAPELIARLFDQPNKPTTA